MNLFVTGGTGFIGSHFLNQAHAAGHSVLALRRSHSSQPRINLEREPVWLDKPMDEITANDLKGAEVMVHFAAHTPNVPYDTLENCLYWNVNTVVQLTRRAHSAGVRRIIAAGSCFEYGRAALRFEAIPTNAPLEPTQSYPASKAAAAIALSQLAIELDLEFTLLRIFQVYGPGESESRFWPALKRAADANEDFPMTAGEQVRDFAPVEWVAEQFISRLSKTLLPGQPKIDNLGTGHPQTLLEFARYWWQKWDAKGDLKIGALPYRQNEIMRYIPEV